MIKKIFEKHETLICIMLIVMYVVMNSYCLKDLGSTDYRSAIINTIFSIALFALIFALDRRSYYGLVKIENWKKFLYFIPLLLISSTNLWNGIHIENTAGEIVFHVIMMINVGFIEEVIFRGFLFKMIAKDNMKSAIIISSLTFGMGHIVNLLRGAAFVSTLLQMCYATAIGYLFVVIFLKSKSLIPCIISHAVINSLSILPKSSEVVYAGAIFLIVVPLIYAIYINKTIKE